MSNIEKKIKALFVTRSIGNHGSVKSLQLLLQNYDQVEFDLVVGRKSLTKKNLFKIRRWFGDKPKEIHEIFLPGDLCYKGSPKLNTIYKITEFFGKKLLWLLFKRKFFNIVNSGSYDFVHINSLSLHRLVQQDVPSILHVREMWSGKNSQVVNSVLSAAGVIFIDPFTHEPFKKYSLKKYTILNNPIDMRALERMIPVQVDNTVRLDLDPQQHTVFSLIGNVSENKGVDFVIDCFTEADCQDARLLIVGGGDEAYLKQCRNLAEGDSRILFWGEESEIQKIYAMSDYVVRGEDYPCVGRTVYEGLYAGCGVFVPGSPEVGATFFEYEKFKNDLFFYPPRERSALISLFECYCGRKRIARSFCSNVDEYVNEFHGFISNTCCEFWPHGE